MVATLFYAVGNFLAFCINEYIYVYVYVVYIYVHAYLYILFSPFKYQNNINIILHDIDFSYNIIAKKVEYLMKNGIHFIGTLKWVASGRLLPYYMFVFIL